MAATIPAVSTEYLHGPVTANVALDTQVVEVAFITPSSATPNDTTSWVTATWEGGAATTRTWRVLIGPGTPAPLAVGSYGVWVRITDTPEVPVRKHDVLTIQ